MWFSKSRLQSCWASAWVANGWYVVGEFLRAVVRQ